MAHHLHILENDYWRAGILPDTGASVAFGQIRKGDEWIDVLRPTPERDYGNSSNTSSFIMLPWCNRIKNGLLRFKGDTFQLRTTKDDGTARHGDVRGRKWNVESSGINHIILRFNSRDSSDVNWPFPFSARAEYRLNGDEFTWRLTLKNEYERPMPGGFGYHPYFVRPTPPQDANGTDGDGEENPVLVQIHCDRQFELKDYMAIGESVPIKSSVDFRRLRALDEQELNDVLTDTRSHLPSRIVYPHHGIELRMLSDPIFEHILIFAPAGKPYFAVEPMTNVSDGFNLYESGIPGSGVFILSPGEERSGTVIFSFREHA
jgi:aldose 1-epimerase